MERFCASGTDKAKLKKPKRCLIAWKCALISILAIVPVGTSAVANSANPYQITAREKAACAYDAARLCALTYPDEHQLLGCMKINRSALGATCKIAFDSGLKRRHLE